MLYFYFYFFKYLLNLLKKNSNIFKYTFLIIKEKINKNNKKIHLMTLSCKNFLCK